MKKNIKNPLVTIITPTYNRADYISETIESILSQDYKNIEYIVLDDGSKDETVNILKKYNKKFIWESHANMGEVRTVNKGFSMAHGEIIGVVNSDDPLLPGVIREIVACMTNHPEIIVVYPDWKMIDKDGKTIEKVPTITYSYEHMVKEHYCIPGPATFFRKVVIDTLKGRDTKFKYVSDYDFWLRAGLIGTFARIPKTLATWRLHPGAATIKNKGYEMAMEHIRVLNKLYANPDVPEEIRNVKKEAYAKACEAARICRGNNFLTKVIISLMSLYYAPYAYLKLFFVYRFTKLQSSSQ